MVTMRLVCEILKFYFGECLLRRVKRNLIRFCCQKSGAKVRVFKEKTEKMYRQDKMFVAFSETQLNLFYLAFSCVLKIYLFKITTLLNRFEDFQHPLCSGQIPAKLPNPKTH